MFAGKIKAFFTCKVFISFFYYFIRDASMMSMRRKIAGLKPEQIRQLATEEVDLPVSTQDFTEAINKCNKSVSKQDLEKYEMWMQEFGSS